MFRSEKPAPTTMNKPLETVSPGKINSIMEGPGSMARSGRIAISALTARKWVGLPIRVISQSGVIEVRACAKAATLKALLSAK